MPRERAKLSDKQERILVQAQLMGLTARDMQQIGNRLIALQKEAEVRREIDNTCQGYTWEKIKETEWRITTPEGHIVESKKTGKVQSHWNSCSVEYDFKISKPGTRFKTRNFQKRGSSIDHEWKKKLMPAQSKELYSIIRWIEGTKWEWQ